VSEHLVVLPEGGTRHRQLEADGWAVIARSWAAELDLRHTDRRLLRDYVGRVGPEAVVRELGCGDVDMVLQLDAATAGDYPGGVATRHGLLTRERATPSARRRGFGAFTSPGDLAAMTFVDVHGNRAEIDFTVVATDRRGRGLGTAVKAAAVLALIDTRVRLVRTGGSAENAAIRSINDALGFVVDEHWVTLAPPA